MRDRSARASCSSEALTRQCVQSSPIRSSPRSRRRAGNGEARRTCERDGGSGAMRRRSMRSGDRANVRALAIVGLPVSACARTLPHRLFERALLDRRAVGAVIVDREAAERTRRHAADEDEAAAHRLARHSPDTQSPPSAVGLCCTTDRDVRTEIRARRARRGQASPGRTTRRRAPGHPCRR